MTQAWTGRRRNGSFRHGLGFTPNKMGLVHAVTSNRWQCTREKEWELETELLFSTGQEGERRSCPTCTFPSGSWLISQRGCLGPGTTVSAPLDIVFQGLHKGVFAGKYFSLEISFQENVYDFVK